MNTAVESNLAHLSVYTTAVDQLSPTERHKLLLECLQVIPSEDLQDALREGDETNQDKRWLIIVDEMRPTLH